MAFKLNSVVPWGRNLGEYRSMFCLTDEDMRKRIAGFGDGPASFNCEASRLGFSVTSFDPVYRFSAEELENRIEEVCGIVMEQMRENAENYVWTQIRRIWFQMLSSILRKTIVLKFSKRSMNFKRAGTKCWL